MELVFNTIKDYPHMIKIYIYREPLKITQERRKRRIRRQNPECAEASIKRTKTAIKDLCICNEFDYFATFTFNPSRKGVEAKNIKRCRYQMCVWLENQRRTYAPNMRYLVIPELHKSGAVHFHALIADYPQQNLHDSGKKINGRTCYNIGRWHWGFSTAVKIDNIDAVANYVSKYITKDMVLLPGAKRYFCSRHLIRPEKTQNVPFSFIRSIVPFRSEMTIDEDLETYTIFKKDIDNIHSLMLR